MKQLVVLFSILFSLSLVGCSQNHTLESFLRQDVDLSYINRVAVLPFENNSQDRYVAERVRDLTITQALTSGMFDVVDKGITDSILADEAVDLERAPMSEVSMKRVAQRLNVQAFMMGTIDNAGDVRKGDMTFPELSLTLRLVDANTGTIFWHASGNENGDFLAGRLFGLSPDDSFRVSLNLIKKMLASIPMQR